MSRPHLPALLLPALLLSLSACGDDEPGECAEPLEAGWTSVFYEATQLDRSVLSAWASGPDDVYLVGGGLGVAGATSLAMHWDGTAFAELPTGARLDTLWWVWGAPGATTDVWMVGENGLILRWDGTSITEVASGVTSTLYGVWGSSGTDVWIVGGEPGAGMVPGNDLVLHWDGQTMTPETLPTLKGAALFKVWGSSADDMWVVGEYGTIWRRTVGGWMDYGDTSLTTYTLFTVHGCSADEVYAVGSGNRVLGFDGNAWTRLDEAMLPSQPNGVACGADTVLVVGSGGMKSRFDKAAGMWIDEQSAEPWDTDFHGALVNSDGSLWAVGGNFVAPPDVGGRFGVVGYVGCEAPTP